MLNRENAPFLLTLLLGFVAWTLTHAVDRVAGAPLLKYEVSERRDAGGHHVAVLFSNVSGVMFKNVEVAILLQGVKGQIVGTPVFTAELPMLVAQSEPRVAADSVSFVVGQIQPGARFRIAAELSDDATPLVGGNSTEAAISLTRPSLATWLMEHDVAIFVGLSALGAIGVLVYIIILVKSSANRSEQRYEV